MEYTELKNIADEWNELTYTVLDLDEIPYETIHDLLFRSEEAIQEFLDVDLIPKSVALIFLRMDEFLYFASLMEKNETEENFYFYTQTFDAVKLMKNRFFGIDV